MRRAWRSPGEWSDKQDPIQPLLVHISHFMSCLFQDLSQSKAISSVRILPSKDSTTYLKLWFLGHHSIFLLSPCFTLLCCRGGRLTSTRPDIRDLSIYFSLSFHLRVVWPWDSCDPFLVFTLSTCKVRFIISCLPLILCLKELGRSDEIMHVKVF